MAGNKFLYFKHVVLAFLLAALLCGCGRDSVGQIVTTGVEKEDGTEEKYGLEKGYEAVENGTKESGAEENITQGNGWNIYNTEDTGISSEKIGVYIFGAVNNPGVYYLDSGSRLLDAVNAAGGFKKKASKTSLNQAAYLKDGQQIRILTKKQAKKQIKDKDYEAGRDDFTDESCYLGAGNPPDEERPSDNAALSSEGSLVNINSAGKEELMTLSGIGEAKAEAVISYRSEQGSFNSIEDIMKVPGIKEGTYNKIKGQITV